ncbi:hydantoinase B/oxoprolinase family protein [Pseudonocardia sp. GCM10023141]|uniref:hydantoinase B/oxoprolinase family protein n=1 Tax=Pseudonocardia sp. GCM10023141 TaxID=3252653 RepID=UPI00360E5F3A
MTTDTTALRDLSDGDFAARYGADRFTAGVLASRMRYVVDHMCAGLLNNAFSSILRDWYDFAATIAGPPEQDYAMSTVSNSLAVFLGTMGDAVRNTIEEYGVENVEPGDIIIANDPYRVGNHVNDMCFIRPIFHDGRIISFVTIRAHQLDMGGVVPAGFSATKRNSYENGLVLSPTRLYAKDRPVRSTFNLIFDNARMAPLLFPDIKSIYQALLLAERLIGESIERYGAQAFLGAIAYTCDASAEAMSTALIEKIPDGVYEAEEGIDADGLDDSITYRLKIRIAKQGDRVEVDLSGTSEQARTCVNASALDAKTAIAVGIKMLIDQRTPFNSGSFRNIDLVVPPGTICSATPPDGAIFLYWESTMPVLQAVYRALSGVLGVDAVGGDYGSLMLHNANGVTEDGTPWTTVAECGGEHGPWGATKVGDGDSYMVAQLINNIDPATEAIEASSPVVVLRKEYAADTAGAGTNRGGASVRRDTLYLRDAEHWSSPLHTKSPSGVGAYGGTDGTTQACWMFAPESFDIRDEQDLLGTGTDVYARSQPIAGVLDPESKVLDPAGDYHYFASTPIWRTTPRTIFRYQTGGGGGWGDPLAREPERVMRDVRDEYVSIEGAYRDYGVVVEGDPIRHPEQLTVDLEATTRRRAELAAGR